MKFTSENNWKAQIVKLKLNSCRVKPANKRPPARLQAAARDP